MDLEPCPGCGTRYAPHAGPTHRYIGASPACWALYTAILAGSADEDILATSAVDAFAPRIGAVHPSLDATVLLADAYAAQHHGVPSPVATRSVDVHLLTLYGVFRAGIDPKNAHWPRSRGLRDKDVYSWLTPPALGSALSVRHFFPGGGVAQVCTVSEYALSVLTSWESVHGAQLASWYERYVLSD